MICRPGIGPARWLVLDVLAVGCALLGCLAAPAAWACQSPAASESRPGPAAASHAARKLAPGVLRVVPPSPHVAETYTGPMGMVEILSQKNLEWDPFYEPKTRTLFDSAGKAILRRDIWNLEFSFKPLRLVRVDVPQPSGKMQRKMIWYLVYRIRYRGEELAPQQEPTGVYATRKAVSTSGRYFFPQFVLEGHEFNKLYQDRIIPATLGPIVERERPDGPLHDSITVSAKPIPLSGSRLSVGVWGVATWEDVDPRIDYVSVYVKGLTNAYKPVDVPGVFKAGDAPGTGRQFLTKTLRLNFWRPGDVDDEERDKVRFGVPVEEKPDRQAAILRAYGLKERLDYSWIYR